MSDLDLTPVIRLTKDLKNAARTLSDDEARFLVDAYYAMQDDRIRAAHQHRSLTESGEPADVMTWLLDQREILEKQVARALVEHLITYGTGASVQFADRDVVETILQKAKPRDHGLRTLIHEIVQSPVFQTK